MLIRRKKKTSAAPAEETPLEAAGGGLQVLFIGNSLTYGHDLPLIVQALARAAGEECHVEAITYGGFSLDDHWHAGTALRAIASRRWNAVLLQHGPSSLPASRVELRQAAQRFAPRIRKVGGRPALYMVWPEQDRFAYFDAVRDSYSLAASDIDGMFIPAGEAWRAAWRRDPDAPLYGFDGFHPSAAGAYAAALSIYGMLYGRAPQGLPARLELAGGGVVQLPPALATLLQDAAAEANQTYGRP